MKCIVPMAGPDLFDPVRGFRPLVVHRGEAVVVQALQHRRWRPRLADHDYIFVLREVPDISILEGILRSHWRGCRIVRLSHQTEGALMSVLAGLAQVGGDEAVIVDLADILFGEGPADPQQELHGHVGAIVPVFQSSNPAYSYLRSEKGVVVEAAEKRVISHAASAGVYMFKDAATLLDAAAHSLRHRSTLAHRGSLYVCPAVNGVLAQGMSVLTPWVENVEAVGKSV